MTSKSVLYDMVNSIATNDDYIDQHNETNKLITADDVERMCEENFNILIKVNDIKHYQRALTHSSYVNTTKTQINSPNARIVPLQSESYEIYEFLGDSILKPIIATYLFTRYPYENEGFMTLLKIKLEEKSAFYKLALKLKLGDYMLISKQTENTMGRYSKNLLEDCLEALIAALYLDQNFETCRKAFWYILETEIPYSEYIYCNTEYKGQLMNFYHKNGWSYPVYVQIDMSYVNGRRLFTMGVKDNKGSVIAQGVANDKKTAEQQASMIALYNFGVIEKDQMVDN